jgi:flagellar hook-associated protein 2
MITHVASQAVTGRDAAYTLDGVARTAATNVVDDAIPGLRLALKALTPSSTDVTVNVGTATIDTDAIKGKVKAFVDAYNTALDAVRSRLNEKRVPRATTAADAVKGVLFADTSLSRLVGQMRATITAAVAGNPATLDELSELGISTGAATGTFSRTAVDGRLVVDDAKLGAALSADPDAVKSLLAGPAGLTGFAQAMEGTLAPYLAGDGILQSRLQAADAEQDRLADSLSRFDARMTLREQGLRAQFTTLERALSQGQSQGQWLEGQLAGLR